MADVWLGRISRWLEKYANAKGGPIIVEIGHQLQAVAPLSIGTEDRYLQSWNRFAVVANQPGVATTFSRVRIRNPVASNVVIVLEQLRCFTTTAVADNPFVTWGATVTDLATLVTLTFTRMDPRGNPQPVAIVSTASQAAGGQALLQGAYTGANITSSFIDTVNQEIPILPGQVLDVQANAANSSLIVNLMWRERPLENSELA